MTIEKIAEIIERKFGCYTETANLVAREIAEGITALEADIERWRSNSRETFEAMCAMRNSINEHIPMPSLESDLLQGPENSVFCATVASAVVSELSRVKAERDEAVGLLRELHSMVWGECPSVLDEDRGGCARLDVSIESFLSRMEGRKDG